MSENLDSSSHRLSTWAVPGGLLLAALVGWSLIASGQPVPVAWTAGVTVLCASWWMTEAVPLPATALLPLAIFPLVGVLTPGEVAAAYGDPIILLFLGGFLLSGAMEKSGAHRRIALGLVQVVGHTARRLVPGFMVASALLSMWISNTATALMLLPVALAVVAQSDQLRLQAMVLLAIAYGASIGGLATPIGSPPNLVFLSVYKQFTGVEMGFLGWMSLGVPVAVLLLPLAALRLMRGLGQSAVGDLPTSGAWGRDEKVVLTVFALTALGWITRTDPFGGWSHWLGLPGANDASVALIGALVLFLWPDGRGGRVMDWEATRRVPWGMLILFGGGITIAKAFVSSGLNESLGQLLAGVGAVPVVLLVLGLCLGVTFLTEINSNTATAVLLMPILAATALATDIDPRLLMVPAALSASCAFMLPVATPPNAIVYGSGKLPMQVMMREGIVLNIIGAAVITLVCVLRL